MALDEQKRIKRQIIMNLIIITVVAIVAFLLARFFSWSHIRARARARGHLIQRRDFTWTVISSPHLRFVHFTIKFRFISLAESSRRPAWSHPEIHSSVSRWSSGPDAPWILPHQTTDNRSCGGRPFLWHPGRPVHQPLPDRWGRIWWRPSISSYPVHLESCSYVSNIFLIRLLLLLSSKDISSL